MMEAIRWILLITGAIALVPLLVAWAVDRSPREPRRPSSRARVVYRPQPLPPPVVRHDSEDEQAIRDHERLVEQYRGLVDELYDYGEGVVRRARREP